MPWRGARGGGRLRPVLSGQLQRRSRPQIPLLPVQQNSALQCRWVIGAWTYCLSTISTGVESGGGGGGKEGMCPPLFLLGGNGMFVPPHFYPHILILHLNYMFI